MYGWTPVGKLASYILPQVYLHNALINKCYMFLNDCENNVRVISEFIPTLVCHNMDPVCTASLNAQKSVHN